MSDSTCFLTGEDLLNGEKLQVFPDWILERFGMRGSRFRLIDNKQPLLYEELVLPCSVKVKDAFDKLEKEAEVALNGGYEAIKDFPEEKLFQWMGKMVYGVLYHDLLSAKQQHERERETFRISPVLEERFGLFHFMLQSVMMPFEFKGLMPWSITVVRLKYSKDVFNYRDDSVNLIFSLGMNGFGIIATLQDNGVVKKEHCEVIEKIGETILHPVQFEELCARFLYSNYLLQYKPKFKIGSEGEKVLVEAIPIEAMNEKPLFGQWDENTYANVLTEYWKPWGLAKHDVVKPPNAPISFLENYLDYGFIQPDSIALPF